MTKQTKPTKQKNLRRMPAWIRSRDYQFLNTSEKNLLAYLYRFEPYTCRPTNRQLAEKFYVTSRTIQRWLNKLEDIEHIRIEKPGTCHRLIHLTGIGKISE